MAYFNKGVYGTALITQLEALKIAEEIHNKPGIGDAHLNLGMVYQNLARYPEAIKNYFTAVSD